MWLTMIVLSLASFVVDGLEVAFDGSNEGYFVTLSNCSVNYEGGSELNTSDSGHLEIQTISVKGCSLNKIDFADIKANLTDHTIKSFSFRGNQVSDISALPTSGFTELTELIGSENVITVLYQGLFSASTALVTLDLNNNLIGTIERGSLDPLVNLENLVLTDNRIQSLESGILSQLVALKELRLQYNRLGSIPSDLLYNNMNLRHINLNSNLLRELPRELLAYNFNLTYFCIHNNQVSEIPEGFFEHASKLQRVHLNRNHFASFNENVFKNLTSLIFAPLEDNPISCECKEGGNNTVNCTGCDQAGLMVTHSLDGTKMFSCAQFTTSEKGTREFDQFSNNASHNEYFVREVASLSVLNGLNKSDLFENYANGDSSAIRFSIRFIDDQAPGEMLFINSETGDLVLTPNQEGNFMLYVSARDDNNNEIDIANWTMNVTSRPEFEINVSFDCQNEVDSSGPYFANHTYVFEGINFTECKKECMFVHPANNDFNSITFDIDWGSGVQPEDSDDTFINSRTGKLSLTPSSTGYYNPILIARDNSGSRVNVSEWYMNVTVYPEDETNDSDGSSDSFLIILIVLAVIICSAILVAGVYTYKRYKELHTPHDFAANMDDLCTINQNGGRASSSSVLTVSTEVVIPIELPRNSITLGESIGSGAFGDVRRAIYRPPLKSKIPAFDVAVKQLKADPSAAERDDLFREAAITAQFDHNNVVMLVGVVTSGSPIQIVIQFCSKGSLEGILRRSVHNDTKTDVRNLRRSIQPDPVSTLDNDTIYAYVIGICNGMNYLASRGFVHRDLATRNVLIDSSDTPKLADFGLSREFEDSDYYMMSNSETRLPLRWAAPETIMEKRFSEKSDVWSFGVTCIECWTYGQLPYRGWLNTFVVEQVVSGYVLPRPASCLNEVYSTTIKPCFEMDPHHRPDFSELLLRLGALAPIMGKQSRKIARGLAVDRISKFKLSIDGAHNNNVPSPFYSSSSPFSSKSVPKRDNEFFPGDGYEIPVRSLRSTSSLDVFGYTKLIGSGVSAEETNDGSRQRLRSKSSVDALGYTKLMTGTQSSAEETKRSRVDMPIDYALPSTSISRNEQPPLSTTRSLSKFTSTSNKSPVLQAKSEPPLLHSETKLPRKLKLTTHTTSAV